MPGIAPMFFNLFDYYTDMWIRIQTRGIEIISQGSRGHSVLNLQVGEGKKYL